MKRAQIAKIFFLIALLIQPLAARQPGVAKSVNMGPTGIRVLMTKEQPNFFQVRRRNT